MNLQHEFGGRLVTLRDGRQGLRSDVSLVRGQTETLNGRKVYYFRASDATLDRYNEVIEPSGWEIEDYCRNNVVVDSHRYDSIQWLIGNAVDIRTSNDALVLGIVFSQANPLGRLAEGMVEEDSLKSGSVGFIPLDWKNGKGTEPARRYVRQALLEFSLTAIPANPNALKLALSSGRIDEGEITELIDALKTICNEPAAAEADTRALGDGGDEAQWLQLARSLSEVMKRN